MIKKLVLLVIFFFLMNTGYSQIKENILPLNLNGTYNLRGQIKIPVTYFEKTVFEETYGANKLRKKEEVKNSDIYNFLFYTLKVENNSFSITTNSTKKNNAQISIRGFFADNLKFIQQLQIEETYENISSSGSSINKFLIKYSLQNLELIDSKIVDGKVTYLRYVFNPTHSFIHKSDIVFNYLKEYGNSMRSSKSTTQFNDINTTEFEKKLASKLPPIELKFYLNEKEK